MTVGGNGDLHIEWAYARQALLTSTRAVWQARAATGRLARCQAQLHGAPRQRREGVTDKLAGATGFTRVLMWNGSFGDSRLLTPDVLLTQARRYLQPGTVMLGHANHLTIARLFDAVLELLRERDLRPVTLDEMFGTSRRIG